MAPVLCDRCAGRATRRARVGMSTGTFSQFPATTALLTINAAVFIGMILGGGSPGGFDPAVSKAWGANVGPLTLSGDYWRLITAGFVHGSLYHIAFNMWALWNLGQLAERLFGSWITLAVYLLTGVGGALLSIAWNPFRSEVGASGAIFGIAGAILSGIKFGNIPVASIHRRAILSSLVFFAGFNLVMGAALPGIDNMCHLGGLVTGLIFGVPLATASASGKKGFEWATIAIAALVLAGAGAQVVKARAPVVQTALHEGALMAARQYIASGNYTRAIILLEELTAYEPGYAEAQATLGQAYEGSGQRNKAIAAYEKALALSPNNPAIKQRLERLRNQAD